MQASSNRLIKSTRLPLKKGMWVAVWRFKPASGNRLNILASPTFAIWGAQKINPLKIGNKF
jgi:hypothetical protein